MIYESFFRLTARPFPAAPVADRYVPVGSMEQARETITRCVERAEGPAVILGSAGTGKSMLCQVLAHRLRDRYQVAVLDSARLCTRRALLQNILFELQLPYRDREEGELRLALIDYLQPREDRPNGLLLIVDEAHTLPLRLLEEIRMLTNVVRHGQPRVRLVLAAHLAFDERLASPRLESLNQRIAARCYLQSLNCDETCQYVRTLLGGVGGSPDAFFSADAWRAIFRATDGVPRLINQVCDHVLLLAAVGGHHTIDARGIEEAWADLQQLPSPWSYENRPGTVDTGAQEGMLEFGELDDSFADELPPPSTSSLGGGVLAQRSSGDQPHDAVEAVEDCLTAIESGVLAMAAEPASAPAPGPSQCDDDEQFRPASTAEPEIELVLPQTHNPFDEPFEQEEVLVDPFASLGTLQASLSSVATFGPPCEPAPSPSPPAQRLIREHELVTPQTEVHRDEQTVPVTRALPMIDDAGPLVPRLTADSERAESQLPSDDRDILEVHEDHTYPIASEHLALMADQPRRREYRRLFATLRQRR